MEALVLLCLVLLTPGCGGQAGAAPAPAAQSSAQANVALLPQLLDMPGLDRQRQIRIYVPPSYASSGKRYPVLYMHDGQNLFDAATAYAGEWNVDETMNELAASGQLELIVVGIDNGQDRRMTELNAWSNPAYGPAEGRQYMDFIVKVVKPLIDQQYRTRPERADTAIMGSSMGGLVSHYAINQYPQVFGKAGIFSPSYWVAAPVFDFIAAQPAARDARLYLLMGQLEGGSMVPDVERAYAAVLGAGHPVGAVSLRIVPGAGHNEAFWRAEFRAAVLWLFAPELK
ncbi:MAG: alpha/beta hydrolase-fold protein [Pseudomonadota bacterium]